MRILQIDRKNNVVKVVPEVRDDLWHLERVLEKHDLVSGTTDRRIKAKEPGGKAERVKMFLQVEVEGIEFDRHSGVLRANGKIVEGKPEDLLEKGAHHSLEIELGRKIEIKKERLKRFQIERLERAVRASHAGKMLLVVLDDEQADFALLREFGIEEKVTIRSGKHGKRQEEDESIRNKYFQQIVDKAREIDAEKVVFAGPGFTKNNLRKFMEGKGVKVAEQLFFEGTNSVGKTGLQELLKGNALEKIAQEMQVLRETKLVEKIFEELGKDSGLVAIGLRECEKAADFGAVEKLLVLENFFLENREKVEEIMDKVEKARGEIHLVGKEHEAGEKLHGIGGISALLRYQIQ